MPTIPSWWNIYYQCKIHLLLHLIFVFTEIQIIEFSPNSAVIIDQNIILYFVFLINFPGGYFVHSTISCFKHLIHLFSFFVQFSCSVMSNSLRPHGLQHTRLPCPSPTPRACSNSCESVMPSNHLILCHPLFLLPSIFPKIQVFSNDI